MKRAGTGLAVVAVLAMNACAEDPSGTALRRNNGSSRPPGDDTSATNPPGDVGNVAIHRLNAAEYDNTIRDLIGDDSHPSASFPPDDGAGSFTNNADALTISPLLFESYEAAAEKLAAVAVTGPGRSRVITCDPAALGDEACATQSLTSFVKRAWRRPVTSDEIGRLVGLLAVAKSEGEGFDAGMTLAVKATLLSPSFLYRVEIDPDPTSGTPHALSDYEVASRLSYFLWSTMPDDALFAAADAGKLQTADDVEAQARRMLKDPRSRALLDNFASQWFMTRLANAAPSPDVFTGYDDDLKQAMAEETKQFVGSFLFEDRSFTDILDAKFSFVNERLAKLYGIPGVTGTSFVRTDLTQDSHRAGLLTQASFLTETSIATRTSPVRRGAWVLENLLCTQPPAPPPNVPALPATNATGTMRQRMEAHRSNPACSGCHTMMDPIGLAFEHFDGIGRWRDTDQGQPIDATGQLTNGATFDGAGQLADVIRNDARFTKCATRKFFSYSLGREPRDYDQTRLDALGADFAKQGYHASQLVIDIVRNDAFRKRRGGT